MTRYAAFAAMLLLLGSACIAEPEDSVVQTDAITKREATQSVPAVGFLFPPNRTPFCTGVLIAPDVVLTARHCFPAKGNRFGVDDGRFAEISDVVPSETVDLTYLVLKQAFRDVRLAEVERSPHTGHCDYVALGYANDRKEAVSLCADAGLTHTKSEATALGSEWIRAYSETRSSTCQGDSGGPLRIANTMRIVGILGFGKGACGTSKKQSFYTPLANNLGFVDEALSRSNAR
jgi:secreted trypsin-like serine protease